MLQGSELVIHIEDDVLAGYMGTNHLIESGHGIGGVFKKGIRDITGLPVLKACTQAGIDVRIQSFVV